MKPRMKWTKSSCGSSISVRCDRPRETGRTPRTERHTITSVTKDIDMFENQKAGIKELTERLKSLRGYL